MLSSTLGLVAVEGSRYQANYCLNNAPAAEMQARSTSPRGGWVLAAGRAGESWSSPMAPSRNLVATPQPLHQLFRFPTGASARRWLALRGSWAAGASMEFHHRLQCLRLWRQDGLRLQNWQHCMYATARRCAGWIPACSLVGSDERLCCLNGSSTRWVTVTYRRAQY